MISIKKNTQTFLLIIIFINRIEIHRIVQKTIVNHHISQINIYCWKVYYNDRPSAARIQHPVTFSALGSHGSINTHIREIRRRDASLFYIISKTFDDYDANGSVRSP